MQACGVSGEEGPAEDSTGMRTPRPQSEPRLLMVLMLDSFFSLEAL